MIMSVPEQQLTTSCAALTASRSRIPCLASPSSSSRIGRGQDPTKNDIFTRTPPVPGDRSSNDGSTSTALSEDKRSIGLSAGQSAAPSLRNSGLPASPMRDETWQQRPDSPIASSSRMTYQPPPKMQSFKEAHGLQGAGLKSGYASPLSSTPASLVSKQQQELPGMSSSSPPHDEPHDDPNDSDEGDNMDEVIASGRSRHLPVDMWVSENGIGVPPGRKKKDSGIAVAVRIRPLSDKEVKRGDHAVWDVDKHGNIGQRERGGGFSAKYCYDTVFGPELGNKSVYESIAQPMIMPALEGINGTIFAYGVTSSGKTHTMIGSQDDPGIVPSIIEDLFLCIERTTTAGGSTGGQPLSLRSFTVRVAMMEIYNEVLNDLLEPSHTNLRVYEEPGGRVVVDGLHEEPVTSAHQALATVARGERHRKVGCTAFNDDSSRSHTICRLQVDARDPTSATRSTSATICLIDLAGSESAKVTSSRGQRMEGSYINKSLLTLGTVINKLAAGKASHIPFRDSKLTRLLQNSLSGAGAKIAIVCNITPAAAQSEETNNTLKFAMRAKLVRVATGVNELKLDDQSTIRRLRAEVRSLRKQVRLLSATQQAALLTPRSSVAGDYDVGGDPLAPLQMTSPGAAAGGSGAERSTEVRALQYRLGVEQRERQRVDLDKAALEVRLRNLTRLLMSDGRMLASGLQAAMESSIAGSAGVTPTQPPLAGPHSKELSDSLASYPLPETPMDDRIDGAEGDDDEGGERELLATIRAMQEEMATSPSYSASAGAGQPEGGSVGGAGAVDKTGDSSQRNSVQSWGATGDLDKDLEIQVLLADREVLQDQVVEVEMRNEQLNGENEELRLVVQTLGLEKQKTRRVLRELESDMLALRSFKNQKDAELLELRKHERQLQDALEEVGRAVSGGNAKLAQQQQGLVQQLRAIQGSGSAPLDHEVMQARLDALEKAVLGTMSAAIAKNAALEAALVESSARRQQQQQQ